MANDVKILKLITGEEVMARVTEGDNGLISLDKPMILQAVPSQQTGQMGFALIPWLMSAKGEKITISIDHVIVQDEVKPEVEKNYLANVTGLTL